VGVSSAEPEVEGDEAVEAGAARAGSGECFDPLGELLKRRSILRRRREER